VDGAAAAVGEAVRAGTTRPRTRGRKARRRSNSVPRAQTGTILADDEYELPILAILDEHGGRAPTREVLDALGERLGDRLMPADHESLASGDIRWRNRAQFVRLHLIESGDMQKGSPRGLWGSRIRAAIGWWPSERLTDHPGRPVGAHRGRRHAPRRDGR